MSSGNADTAFASNCDRDYNYSYGAYTKYCVVFQCINVLHSIMEIMLLWISKCFLKIELLLLYKAIFINSKHHFE